MLGLYYWVVILLGIFVHGITGNPCFPAMLIHFWKCFQEHTITGRIVWDRNHIFYHVCITYNIGKTMMGLNWSRDTDIGPILTSLVSK